MVKAILGFMGFMLFSYLAYTRWHSPTASIIILIIGVITFIGNLLKEENQHNIPSEAKPSKEEDTIPVPKHYNEFECEYCKGKGYVFACQSCGNTDVSYSPGGEYWEPEFHCYLCSAEGKDDTNVDKEQCKECNGRGVSH